VNGIDLSDAEFRRPVGIVFWFYVEALLTFVSPAAPVTAFGCGIVALTSRRKLYWVFEFRRPLERDKISHLQLLKIQSEEMPANISISTRLSVECCRCGPKIQKFEE